MRANCINSDGLNYTNGQQLFTCSGSNTNLLGERPLQQRRGKGGTKEQPRKTLGMGGHPHGLRQAWVGNGRVRWD